MLEELMDNAARGVGAFCASCFVPIMMSLLIPSAIALQGTFKAHRMQHFDLQGSFHGSRAHGVSMEARSAEATGLIRKCIVVRWIDVSVTRIQELISQAVGAIVILLPKDLGGFGAKGNATADGGKEHKELFESLESDLLELLDDGPVAIPIYFAHETDDLKELLRNLDLTTKKTQKDSTALEVLINSVIGNGYQLVSTSHKAAKALKDYEIENVVGHLSSYEGSEASKTLLLIAHYDAFSISPTLSTGADFNGSGVVALLELARIFSKLYSNNRTRPKHNLVFILSGGGKLNYQGIRHWIDEQLEQQEHSLANMEFGMCLDGIGAGSELYFHVSKPPKEGSNMHSIFQELVKVGVSRNTSVELVHKKINLAEEYLSWEHERLSLKRLLGFTLSHAPSPKLTARRSILDTRSRVNIETLARNVEIITEALIRYLYGLQNLELTQMIGQSGSLAVDRSHLSLWLDYVTEESRSAQLFPGGSKNERVSAFVNAFDHWLHLAQVSPVKVDRKEPEFVLFDQASDDITAYLIKPAVFDLVLALAIGAYLLLIYGIVVNFFHIKEAIQIMIDGAHQASSQKFLHHKQL